MPDPVSDAAIMAALGRQLTRSVQRQSAAAGSLANLDTPGSHARSAVGNNVQLDRELLKLAGAGGEFSAGQTMWSAKFSLVRYAINQGR